MRIGRATIVAAVIVTTSGLGVARGAAPVNVSQHAAVITLDDASAAEQAYIFRGLVHGRDLSHWQTIRRFCPGPRAGQVLA